MLKGVLTSFKPNRMSGPVPSPENAVNRQQTPDNTQQTVEGRQERAESTQPAIQPTLHVSEHRA